MILLVPTSVEKLPDTDKTYYPEGRKTLIKAGAIEAFDKYFTEAIDKERILEFAKEQQNCNSPKTRKIVQDFLRKWGRK